MKRKKLIVLVVVLVLGVLCGIYYLQDSNDPYSNYNQISPRQTLMQRDSNTYYVYFYKADCSYCKEIEKEIKSFADKDNNYVYFVNTEDNKKDIESYDWLNFNTKNDIEIGKLEDGEKVEYYDGESNEKYLNNEKTNQYGKVIRYEIIIADEKYMETNKNAKEGYVYASIQTPEIDYSELEIGREPIIAGVPTLLKIENKEVTEFYFDSVEIKPFLEDMK